jgi:hypothetical protein
MWPEPGSFADKVSRRPSFMMADLVREVDRLEVEHLETMIGKTVNTAIRDGIGLSEYDVIFALAIDVLRFFMGDDWVHESLNTQSKNASRGNASGRKFFKTDSAFRDQHVTHRHQERVTSLATTLYNLQAVPGIAHRIRQLKDSDLETALGELQCALSLIDPSLQFQFIVPISRKGADYEAEFVTPSGQSICCEIKTKKEGTELSQSTIWSTLEKARKQLPNGKPGVIFVRIPESWMDSSQVGTTIEAAIAKITRQSDRVVAIVIASEKWAVVGHQSTVLYTFQPVFNKRSTHYSEDIEKTFGKLRGSLNDRILDLHRFVRDRTPEIAHGVRVLLGLDNPVPDHRQD